MPAVTRVTDPLPDELTAEQAATLLGISVRTLQRLRREGRIGYTKGLGRRVYFTHDDLGKFVRAARVRHDEKASA